MLATPTVQKPKQCSVGFLLAQRKPEKRTVSAPFMYLCEHLKVSVNFLH